VTATDVARTWSQRWRRPNGVPRRIPALGNLLVEGDRILTVSADDPTHLPRLFGTVALGVGRTDGGSRWEPGTGSYALDTIVSGSGRWVLRPVATNAGPILDVLDDRSTDPRDLLDRGADLVITRDPVTLGYARQSESFSVHPLPWDRTYVLAIPSRLQDGTRDAGPLPTAAEQAFRVALARDAVRGEARAAAARLEWWTASAACLNRGPTPLVRRSVGGGSRRIAYTAGDPVARSLAERLVGVLGDAAQAGLLHGIAPELTGSAGTPAMTAQPIRPTDPGEEVAYVIAIPHHTSSPCLDVSSLREVTPWIEASTLIPLIDTRPSVIARRGVPPLSVDWEGTLRIHPGGPPSQSPR
jgi:hypothetical protein